MNDDRPTSDFGFAEVETSRHERQPNGRVELSHHKQAFQLYCRLGSRRSYRAVADEFAVSLSTIKNWSRWFRWQDRLQEWEALQTRQMIELTDRHAQDSLEAKRKQSDKRLTWLLRAMTEGKIRFSSRDMERLESIADELELLIDNLENPDRLRKGKALIMVPDNGRDGKAPDVPESQLDDYIASLEDDPTVEWDDKPKRGKPRWRRVKE